ncbi:MULTISPECIES: DUF4183 domain-containing protein [Bacillus cereus group]|uniref:DUF4183 domain-containing protein n=1 Tax=Bacillus cereus group TaxID=86661 RepID=UPI000BEF4208|nr:MULTISPECIES: DUF4183 domain-containing protein [Bacillus cereus group]PEJ60501.1 hypothetical protein CN685_27830 [Bacillus wiedmannii]UIJ67037.1 DUF4183 domain-containing protein [Bacillus cereus]
MALQLMKIAVAGSTTTTIDPADSRFFYVTTAPITGGSTLTIDAADFLDDTGASVTTLPTLVTDNSYFNVYVNGVLQMEGISTYTAGATGVGSLAIAVPGTVTDTILAGTPIVLEIVQFTPNSTTTVAT